MPLIKQKLAVTASGPECMSLDKKNTSIKIFLVILFILDNTSGSEKATCMWVDLKKKRQILLRHIIQINIRSKTIIANRCVEGNEQQQFTYFNI